MKKQKPILADHWGKLSHLDRLTLSDALGFPLGALGLVSIEKAVDAMQGYPMLGCGCTICQEIRCLQGKLNDFHRPTTDG